MTVIETDEIAAFAPVTIPARTGARPADPRQRQVFLCRRKQAFHQRRYLRSVPGGEPRRSVSRAGYSRKRFHIDEGRRRQHGPRLHRAAAVAARCGGGGGLKGSRGSSLAAACHVFGQPGDPRRDQGRGARWRAGLRSASGDFCLSCRQRNPARRDPMAWRRAGAAVSAGTCWLCQGRAPRGIGQLCQFPIDRIS